ncbi:MAG: efflux RND transporter permease subunit, partial [Pseudomonadota bacterium]
MRPSLPVDTLTFRDLSYHAIRRWRLVLVGSVGLLVLASLAWLFTPRLEEPLIDVPGMSVTLVYPGASADDIEIQVVKTVEEALYELPDIEWIEVAAVPSAAVFNLRFVEGVDTDVMAETARGKIAGRKDDLPAEVKDPIVERWSTASI